VVASQFLYGGRSTTVIGCNKIVCRRVSSAVQSGCPGVASVAVAQNSSTLLHINNSHNAGIYRHARQHILWPVRQQQSCCDCLPYSPHDSVY
jgi:hypothetical protein